MWALKLFYILIFGDSVLGSHLSDSSANTNPQKCDECIANISYDEPTLPSVPTYLPDFQKMKEPFSYPEHRSIATEFQDKEGKQTAIPSLRQLFKSLQKQATGKRKQNQNEPKVRSILVQRQEIHSDDSNFNTTNHTRIAKLKNRILRSIGRLCCAR